MVQSLVNVLMVDDDEDAFVLAQRHLAGSPVHRYVVHWEPNEERAIARMADNKFDVHLVDYRLVHLNGIELFLKAKAAGCKGPVIILTAIGNPSVDVAAMEAGADDYLHKEALYNGLLERAIRYALERQRTERIITNRQLALSHTLKMATLGKMTSSIAHEINNPLAIVTGRLSIMESQAKENKLSSTEALRHLASLKEATTRISRIIRSLYRYSRDGGGDPLEMAEIWKIVNDASELSGPKLTCNDIDLRVGDIAKDLLLECRPLEISHILINLICNAADAVKDLPERWVSVEAHEVGQKIVFAVTDSGKGIPDDLYAQIIQPFFSTKTNGMGMGLGLSIGRDIVEQYGGSLDIDRSSPNTKFVVTVPKNRAGLPASEPMSILIIDDEEAIVTAIADLLAPLGHRILKAHSAMDAHKILQSQPVDVAICDLMMPGVDGAALFRRVKAEGILPRKFIFITGHLSPDAFAEFKQESIEVFTKPFNMADLINAVKSFSRVLRDSPLRSAG